eukprot:CAMPEP_0171181356 /NCGR_PEP_ID=MMETSP0790-20130122/14218_1 /TAXON_ID=2925 /ORGANISM="Alexandrium catenella, Strain OF101" /LENGTH=398 /DNA_ID=CAMNT_0011646293 /DNA_START=73 /DNA_END=1269 /DNA_ORIENTATION=-
MALIAAAAASLLALALTPAAAAGVGEWQASAEDVETSLIAELSSLARGGAHRLEAPLGPIYGALPKNAHGRLEPEAARSALRRLFLQKPGWTLRGLESDAGMGASAPARMLKLVVDRTSGRGLGVQELAAVGGGLEDLSRKEAAARLGRSYQESGLPLAGRSEHDQVAKAVHLYAKAYLGSAATSDEWLQRLEVEQRLVKLGSKDGKLSFEEASGVAMAIERQLSSFKSQECSSRQAAAPGSHCLDVSSLYSLCCRSSEELAALGAQGQSVLAEAVEDFPRLWIFSLVCFSLSALVALGSRLCGSPVAAAAGASEEAAAEGDTAEDKGDAKAEAEVRAEGDGGRGLMCSVSALLLLCCGAVACDLLDAAVIAPALGGGLVLLAVARWLPKQPAKAKKV